VPQLVMNVTQIQLIVFLAQQEIISNQDQQIVNQHAHWDFSLKMVQNIVKNVLQLAIHAVEHQQIAQFALQETISNQIAQFVLQHAHQAIKFQMEHV